jgi:hypothetical protein
MFSRRNCFFRANIIIDGGRRYNLQFHKTDEGCAAWMDSAIRSPSFICPGHDAFNRQYLKTSPAGTIYRLPKFTPQRPVLHSDNNRVSGRGDYARANSALQRYGHRRHGVSQVPTGLSVSARQHLSCSPPSRTVLTEARSARWKSANALPSILYLCHNPYTCSGRGFYSDMFSFFDHMCSGHCLPRAYAQTGDLDTGGNTCHGARRAGRLACYSAGRITRVMSHIGSVTEIIRRRFEVGHIGGIQRPIRYLVARPRLAQSP